MKGIILKVGKIKKSKINGGQVINADFRIIDGELENKVIRFYCDLSHTKSEKFFPYLKPQAMFENLSVIKLKDKLYIDGTSNFTYLGIKGQIK